MSYNPPLSKSLSGTFLSYSHTDFEQANALHSLLEQRLGSVFKDDRAIRSGERWFERLEGELAKCRRFVVLVGRDGVTRWVGAETQVALSRHFGSRGDSAPLAIFPVLLGDTPYEALPPLLALFQVFRWPTSSAAEEKQFVDAVENAVSMGAQQPQLDECPYVGLASFQKDQSHLYFGRARETLEALRKLGSPKDEDPEKLRGSTAANGHCRWLQIFGDSGSGKSSLVRAGLLPLVDRGALWPRTGYGRWAIIGPMMPGREPAGNLAEAVELALKPDGTARDPGALAERFGKSATALAMHLRGAQGSERDGAFLLVIDQFEELVTFAADPSRKSFVTQLASALDDPECPLYIVSTVRIDYSHQIGSIKVADVPGVEKLSDLLNARGTSYELGAISRQGLLDAIVRPAARVGLDVSEVKGALQEAAAGLPGALPLVEYALTELWQKSQVVDHRRRLTLESYQALGQLGGILGPSADRLLADIEAKLPGKGKEGALELLLRLTQINRSGAHSRRRIGQQEAIFVAGNGHDEAGQTIVRTLAGEREATRSSARPARPFRVVSIGREGNATYVDLIHETLLRTQTGEAKEGAKPYWPTLYEYIERNRDRQAIEDEFIEQVQRWQASRLLAGTLRLASWGQWLRYRKLRIRNGTPQARFMVLSGTLGGARAALLLLLVAGLGESTWWVSVNNLPADYIFRQMTWYAGFGPIPKTVDLKPGKFTMGCKPGRDDVEGATCSGEPLPHEEQLVAPCSIGIYEVTFEEYDYYVWSTVGKGRNPEAFPKDENWGRGRRPAIHVSWDDVQRYIQWLNGRIRWPWQSANHPWRLPSEKEWEYAARAGTPWAYWWGNAAGQGNANCFGCASDFGGHKTAPVGSYKCNPWGICDTSGNVSEWGEDRGEGGTETRMARGGSWAGNPSYSRAAARSGGDLDGNYDLGFRVCRGSPIE